MLMDHCQDASMTCNSMLYPHTTLRQYLATYHQPVVVNTTNDGKLSGRTLIPDDIVERSIHDSSVNDLSPRLIL